MRTPFIPVYIDRQFLSELIHSKDSTITDQRFLEFGKVSNLWDYFLVFKNKKADGLRLQGLESSLVLF